MPKKNLLNAKQTNNRHKKECTEVLTVDDMNDLLECNIGLAFITRQDTSQCHESSIHIKSLGLQFSLEVSAYYNVGSRRHIERENWGWWWWCC